MRRLSLLVLAIVLSLAAPLARAGWHVGLGAVDEIDGEGSWMATLAWLTESEHPWEFIAGHLDGRNTAAIRTPDVIFVSVSKRLTWKRWFTQSGIAYANVDNEVLSKHFQFQTALGYDGGRWTLSLRHLSNANTGGRNRGETFLLLDFGF
jgi:hypothetical protein